LRRKLYYRAGRRGAWTRRHRDWLTGLRFEDGASELCFADYLHAHDVLVAPRAPRPSALDAGAAIAVGADDRPAALPVRDRHVVGARALRPRSDFARFGSRQAIAAYLGLVPSENSSGERRRQGSITKAGSAHARRLLVEAAHHYRRPPRHSAALERRQRGQQAWVVDFAWRAQRRLYGRWRHLNTERGKGAGVTAIAVHANSPASVGSSRSRTEQTDNTAPAGRAARARGFAHSSKAATAL
jgi:transposase